MNSTTANTVRIVVGYAPGGGYDFYAASLLDISASISRGNPTSIVENMPGDGSLVSANHLYKLAKADGLTIGHFNGSLFQLQTLRQKEIEFDSTKFEYVRSVAKVEIACSWQSRRHRQRGKMDDRQERTENGRHCSRDRRP